MITAKITDFRTNMKERLREIEEAQDILILSGSKKRDFVVMSLEQYNDMEENDFITTFIHYKLRANFSTKNGTKRSQ